MLVILQPRVQTLKEQSLSVACPHGFHLTVKLHVRWEWDLLSNLQ